MPPPLAHAFLALADDDTRVEQRTLPRVVVATVAAVLLAISTPLAFLFEHDPVAVLSSKSALFQDEE
jgi:hypothetical protein